MSGTVTDLRRVLCMFRDEDIASPGIDEIVIYRGERKNPSEWTLLGSIRTPRFNFVSPPGTTPCPGCMSPLSTLNGTLQLCAYCNPPGPVQRPEGL